MSDPTTAAGVAAARGAAHPTRSERLYEDPNTEDLIGAAGELAFATAFGLSIDTSVRPHGDGGVDFRVRVAGRQLTFDIKTYQRPLHLLVKVEEMARCADILVLCHFDYGVIAMLGWETRGVMSLMPTREFVPGIESHFRLRDELRPMNQLANLLAMREP